MRRYRAVAIAAAGALAMGALEVWSLGRVLTEFARGGADARALVFLAVVQGGILVALTLGVMGTVWGRPGISVAGATLIFFEGIPLIFSFAWLAVLVSGLFLFAARDTALLRGAPLAAARVVGSLAALWALACVPALMNAQPLFLVFLTAALCALAVAAWWPSPDVMVE